jgi:hypothetical protein
LLFLSIHARYFSELKPHTKDQKEESDPCEILSLDAHYLVSVINFHHIRYIDAHTDDFTHGITSDTSSLVLDTFSCILSLCHCHPSLSSSLLAHVDNHVCFFPYLHRCPHTNTQTYWDLVFTVLFYKNELIKLRKVSASYSVISSVL